MFTIKSISIVGLGLVGLTAAVVLANRGVRTVGLDKDYDKLETLSKGSVPFYEPEVGDLLQKTINSGMISFTKDFDQAMANTDLTFVTVSTPSYTNGKMDVSQLKAAVTNIGRALIKKDNYHIVVIRSTVVPGTTEGIVRKILEKESRKVAGKNFGLINNPEFLREGNAVNDLLKPHAIIIGSINDKDGHILERFYRELYHNDVPQIIRTNTTTAEMIKHANNAFLATKVSFINTIANICQRVKGTDVGTVADAIGLDPRIGNQFLQAGPGYGGSCLPKDMSTFITFANDVGYLPSLLESVQIVNVKRISEIISIIERMVGDISGKTISVFGLAFKKNSDDVRDAPSLKLIKHLLNRGALVKAHDFMAIENAKNVLKNQILYCSTVKECISGSDCCVFMTEWDEYRNIDPSVFITNMKNPHIVDARRILDPSRYMGKMKFAMVGSNFYFCD